jgi:dCTP diphosphatase
MSSKLTNEDECPPPLPKKLKTTGANSFNDSNGDTEDPNGFLFDEDLTIEKVRTLQNKFCKERDWDQYHSPRNLLLAMVGEVGELSELFQWRGECQVGVPGWTAKDKEHLEQELADVFIYLVRLSEQCHVNLPKAVLSKIAHNSKKYPAEKVRGSSKKYSDYPQGTKLATPDD